MEQFGYIALGITALVLLAGIIFFDVWLVLNKLPTISNRIKGYAKRFSILTFLVGLSIGILIGHLLWPN